MTVDEMMEDGDALLAEAVKKHTSKPGFFAGLMGRPEQKFEDSYDLAQQAANAFKLKKNWRGAAKAYMHSAAMQEQLKVAIFSHVCYLSWRTPCFDLSLWNTVNRWRCLRPLTT